MTKPLTKDINSLRCVGEVWEGEVCVLFRRPRGEGVSLRNAQVHAHSKAQRSAQATHHCWPQTLRCSKERLAFSVLCCFLLCAVLLTGAVWSA